MLLLIQSGSFEHGPKKKSSEGKGLSLLGPVFPAFSEIGDVVLAGPEHEIAGL